MREFFNVDELSSDDLKAVQHTEMQILLYFDAFCKIHNLRYYLAGGTLIGAVRHKGFIPWDDDVDVHMPRPDYERLKILWEQHADTERYSLCVTDSKRNFRHHAMSICDNYTTWIEEREIFDDVPHGIKIDILPFDGVPDSKLRAAIQFVWAMIFAVYNVQRLPENQGNFLMRGLIYIALRLVQNPTHRYRIWRYAEKQMRKYDFESSTWVRELIAPLKSMIFKYPRKDFDKAIYLEFEGHSLPAHHYYKKYLENVYSGYMTPPPLEDRKPKSRIVYLNLDRSYKDYKGIYYCRKSK